MSITPYQSERERLSRRRMHAHGSAGSGHDLDVQRCVPIAAARGDGRDDSGCLLLQRGRVGRRARRIPLRRRQRVPRRLPHLPRGRPHAGRGHGLRRLQRRRRRRHAGRDRPERRDHRALARVRRRVLLRRREQPPRPVRQRQGGDPHVAGTGAGRNIYTPTPDNVPATQYILGDRAASPSGPTASSTSRTTIRAAWSASTPTGF